MDVHTAAPDAVDERVRIPVACAPSAQGRYVLYWMVANRRLRANHALDRAVAWARHLGRPVLVLEGLNAGYEHASERIHGFVLAGMRDNAAACRRRGVRYLRYVEPRPRAARGLIRALAAHASVVVTDDHPTSPRPRLTEKAWSKFPCPLEFVDSCGIYPIRATPSAFPTAHAFRRHLQRELPARIDARPTSDPLVGLRGMRAAVVPQAVLKEWPQLRADPSADPDPLLTALSIDHAVKRTGLTGGSRSARRRLASFIAQDLDRYADQRNHPDARCESGLSPYLHFGHIGPYEVFDGIVAKEGWTTEDLDTVTRGSRSGWWGMSPSSEAFLDQLVTWRELGFNTCVHLPETYASLASTPGWAQRTLAEHAGDPRPHAYSLQQFEQGRTHSAIWNAAQAQLRREGTLHNYLRMMWGKKILHWSRSPEEALALMVHLNDKYALDGRDPNSYAGILWCFGRYDRPWGPERAVFGTVRFMSATRTEKKLRLVDYLSRFATDRQRMPGHS